MESYLSMSFLVPTGETGVWFCREFCLTFFAGDGEGNAHFQRITLYQFCSAGAGVFWRVGFPVFFEGEYGALFKGFAVRAIADLICVVFRFPSVFEEVLHGFPDFCGDAFFDFQLVSEKKSVKG